MSTPSAPIYPVGFEVDDPGERDRVTVFFRMLLLIPVAIVGAFIGLAVTLAVIAAWFALVFTGRWPAGLHRFVAGGVRWGMRADAYAALLTDRFPPLFDLGEHPEYPARTRIDAPLPAYDRLKVGFRFILMIPVAILSSLLSSVARAAAFVVWVTILFTGGGPEPIFRVIRYCLTYQARALGYFLLLTETWPPLEESATETLPPTGTTLTPTA